MEKNVKLNYSKSKVVLDNQEFIDCVFDDCEMEYSGTARVILNGCHFNNATFTFTGPARNTFEFLHGLYHGLGEDGKNIVNDLFRHIRKAQ